MNQQQIAAGQANGNVPPAIGGAPPPPPGGPPLPLLLAAAAAGNFGAALPGPGAIPGAIPGLPLAMPLPAFPGMAMPGGPLMPPGGLVAPQPRQEVHLASVCQRGRGMLGNFRLEFPGNDPDAIIDWLKKLYACVKSAASGVQWYEVRQMGIGLPPMVISVVVPYTVVHEFPLGVQVTVLAPMQPPPPAAQLVLQVPADVINKISVDWYSAVYNLISYKHSRYYNGLQIGQAWQLYGRLSDPYQTADSPLQLLEKRQKALSCNSLAAFATFQSDLEQLLLDYADKVAQHRIQPSESWAPHLTKQFICAKMAPYFADKLDDWSALNSNATVDQMMHLGEQETRFRR